MPMAYETEPFNGDVALAETVRSLVTKHGIRTIVETGTYHGVTTRALAGMCPRVVTAEKNPKHFERALANLSDIDSTENGAYRSEEFECTHVRNPEQIVVMWACDSREMIVQETEASELAQPYLFYLDSHWGRDWPLLGELDAIRTIDDRNTTIFKELAEYWPEHVIIIHDFLVPGTVLGYDSYDGQDLDWDYVADAVEAIYGKDGYVRSHNDPETATGARRGVLILEPKV